MRLHMVNCKLIIMIVGSMKEEEIYKEIMNDFECLQRRSALQGRILQQQLLRKKFISETRLLNFKTAAHNNWSVMLKAEPCCIKTSYYLKTLDKKGLAAYAVRIVNDEQGKVQKSLLKYTAHFFERYNERMNLKISESGKVLKHFFRNNFDYASASSKTVKGNLRETEFVFNEGIGLGCINDRKNIIQLKTFISRELLSFKKTMTAAKILYDDEFIYLPDKVNR